MASPRGLGEIHRNKILLFVRTPDIGEIILKFGHSSHRPILTMALGAVFLPIGIYGLIECLFAPAGFRYEIGLIALGIIGGSLIHDTLKKRFFLEVHHKGETSRLICSRKATAREVSAFCARAEEAFGYKITNSIPEASQPICSVPGTEHIEPAQRVSSFLHLTGDKLVTNRLFMSLKPSPLLPCAPGDADVFLSEPDEAVVAALQRIPGDFLVLGAGGKMGLHLCGMLRRALDAAGSKRQVTAVSRFRSVNDREQFEKFGVATRPCDLCEPSELESLDPAENIIFMAGAKFGTADQPGLLRKMNVEMPEMVANHFSRSRVTAFSTGCVYSFVPVTSPGSNETSETKPVGAYAQSCLGREQAFRRSALEFGTQLALIRLNYSVEFRYGVLVDIAQKVLRGEPIDIGTGHFNLIWQRDAVAQTILSHELASTVPFVINLTGPAVLRVRDVAQRFGEIFDRPPAFTGQEAETAWLNDASRSHRLFGQPSTSLDQMIEWVAAWQLAGLDTLGKPTGFEKRDGKF